MDPDPTNSLNHRRILVTGGSRGIGAATVELLARMGARVAFTCLKCWDSAQALSDRLYSQGFTVMPILADQRSREDAARTVATVVEAWGGLDGFVGNAGIWQPTPYELPDESTLMDLVETNLLGLFRWNAEVIPAMKSTGKGSIVLISSTAGQRGEAGYSAYAATKGAVISLAKSLASELGPFGIRVNAVAPGWVDTDMSAPALQGDPNERAHIAALFPLGFIPGPEDLAHPIAFLLGDESRAIHGEILNVNGGTVLCG